MGRARIAKIILAASLAFGGISAASAQGVALEAQFDRALGTEVRAPKPYNAVYDSTLERRIAMVAEGDRGRIGVAAVDLSTGHKLGVLDDQRFPMASTSKIAIAATFLEGVEKGRWSLSSEFPLLIAVPSKKFSTATAPVREGNRFQAIDLIEMMITRSSNPATDALLKVVGGPKAVNEWVHRQGIWNFNLSRDIATLVRDDGEIDPARSIDVRDSATPAAMLELLVGLHQGKYLNAESRRVLLGAMSRTTTGKRRIRALMPEDAAVWHKTGSLNNTSSDIGFIQTADGRTIAVAIYVTGQGSRPERENRIASIARAIYDGYLDEPRQNWTGANYGGN